MATLNNQRVQKNSESRDVRRLLGLCQVPRPPCQKTPPTPDFHWNTKIWTPRSELQSVSRSVITQIDKAILEAFLWNSMNVWKVWKAIRFYPRLWNKSWQGCKECRTFTTLRSSKSTSWRLETSRRAPARNSKLKLSGVRLGLFQQLSQESSLFICSRQTLVLNIADRPLRVGQVLTSWNAEHAELTEHHNAFLLSIQIVSNSQMSKKHTHIMSHRFTSWVSSCFIYESATMKWLSMIHQYSSTISTIIPYLSWLNPI